MLATHVTRTEPHALSDSDLEAPVIGKRKCATRKSKMAANSDTLAVATPTVQAPTCLPPTVHVTTTHNRNELVEMRSMFDLISAVTLQCSY